MRASLMHDSKSSKTPKLVGDSYPPRDRFKGGGSGSTAMDRKRKASTANPVAQVNKRFRGNRGRGVSRGCFGDPILLF
uniref:Uncharacterized protein n=1 Tax=Cannabis sativa TaxID=3483 RepID=A0A803QSG9_CANSA